MNGTFRYLFRHFFRSFFDTEFTSGASRSGVGAVLALLAVPGAIMAITLFPKYSALMRFLKRQFVFDPDVASLPDKITLVVFSMAVSGLVAVIKWESLFPDRRDFANLAPLPVASRSILLSKMLALLAFGALFVADINAISTLALPLIVTENRGTFTDLLRFIGAHAVAVSAAGVWSFATVLAVTGVMTSVLPYSAFRRAKRYVQFASISFFVLMLLSTAALMPELTRLRTGSPSWAAWFPPVWFLGLYVEVQGRPMGLLNGLSGIAAISTLAAVALAAVAYVLSYARHYLKAAESVDAPSRTVRFPDWAFRLIDRTVMRGAFNRACFRFVVKTLARSDRHTAAFAAASGLGFAFAVQSFGLGLQRGRPVEGLLPAVLAMIYCVVAGLRLSFGLPADARSNWIFQLTAGDDADPHAVAQNVMALFVAPLIVGSTAALLYLGGLDIAVRHLIFVVLATAILIEFLSLDFRAVPFTCSWLPGGGNPVLTLACFGMGLVVFSQAGGGMEEAMLRGSPIRMIWVVIPMLGCLRAFRSGRKDRERVLFQDTRGELELLRITD